MTFSALKMNLAGTCEKNFQCTVCKSPHPKTTGEKGQAIIIVLYSQRYFSKFLKNANSKNFFRKN